MYLYYKTMRVVNQTGWICIQLTQYNVMGAITNVLKISESLRLEVVDENRRMNDKKHEWRTVADGRL